MDDYKKNVSQPLHIGIALIGKNGKNQSLNWDNYIYKLSTDLSHDGIFVNFVYNKIQDRRQNAKQLVQLVIKEH